MLSVSTIKSFFKKDEKFLQLSSYSDLNSISQVFPFISLVEKKIDLFP